MGSPLYFSWAFVAGLLGAFSYKIVMSIMKYRMRQEFRLRLLIIPYVVSMMVTLPIVFIALPILGPPQGEFLKDLAYAFVTSYTFLDVTLSLGNLQDDIRRYLERKTGKKPDPNEPPPGGLT